MIEEGGEGLQVADCRLQVGGDSALRVPRSPLFQEAELTGGRQHHRLDLLAGQLGVRIELAERFELVAEELQPHRPGRAERPHVHDAATPRELAFVGDLRLGFVAHLFEPLDEIKRVDGLAAPEPARLLPQLGDRERPLQQRGDRSDDDGPASRSGGAARHVRELDERLQALADDVGMRELALVRQDVPGRVEEREPGSGSGGGVFRPDPGREVGVEPFLRLQPFGHHQDRARGEEVREHRDPERLGAGRDLRAGDDAAERRALPQRRGGGSGGDGGEDAGLRPGWTGFRQARATWVRCPEASRQRTDATGKGPAAADWRRLRPRASGRPCGS